MTFTLSAAVKRSSVFILEIVVLHLLGNGTCAISEHREFVRIEKIPTHIKVFVRLWHWTIGRS